MQVLWETEAVSHRHYADYRDHMKIFAMRKAKEGRMNENYAVLYQEFLSNPKTEGQAKIARAEAVYTQTVL